MRIFLFMRGKNLCTTLLVLLSISQSVLTHAIKPVDLVYPYLDSANSRWFYFDSASRPFGMVNLNPDTGLGDAWGSGYRYDIEEVKGFNHVHAWQLSAISTMPLSSTESVAKLKSNYYSSFSHDKEEVAPGYHKLYLDRYNIGVELTATTRVGFHRYQYQKKQPQQVLFQLGGRMGPSNFGHGEAKIENERAISGYVTNKATRRRPRPTKVFFYAEFSRPIENISGWKDDDIYPRVQNISGEQAGLIVTLKNSRQTLLMKVGISYVSSDNAKLNIANELPHWGFDKTVKEAKAHWNQLLSRIKVKGGSREQQRRFYTDLWHALQGRRIISDSNGQYSDQTGYHAQVKQLPLNELGKPKFNHHNSDAFWGAQWTIATLWPLAYPQTASDFTNSLLQYYRDGGLIPRGPSGGNYTFVMSGASSTPFIVSNYMKGLQDFDTQLAYKALKYNHSAEGIMSRAGYEHFTNVGGGMRYYLEKGYIPYPLPKSESTYGNHRRGTGQTLEYAFQDHTLGQFAKALGHTKDAEYFSKRAQNYRNVFDAESGYMRPRNVDGSWQSPFDPFEYENGFVESNPAQGTWYVPHDVEGLASLMGGKDKLVERLDAAFQEASKQDFTAGKAHADEKNENYRRTPINYGNQPSIFTAFIFSAAGYPWKTQYWSRQVVEKAFSGLSPYTGYNGDEDQGLMGSLAVLMKIGLFQLTAGTEPDPIYWIGSPIFDATTIKLNSQYYPGKKFTILVKNNSKENLYVQSIELNGKTLDRTYIYHSEIVRGGKLVLTMGENANLRLR